MVLTFLITYVVITHMNIQKYLKELIDKGFTQAEIAKECGFSQPYVSAILGGSRKKPNFEIVDAIRMFHARIFGTAKGSE
ncbi:hypothetical protein AGMMS49545_15310 [Betaproteobacteria bacterium]|nr:hypothetical protein AGMMS49545_15310 [Betaproteobacteria bacterium]GHU46026.1 hypothetical protein AGMMS50289_18470 [Betaproteobacteria bacterium]